MRWISVCAPCVQVHTLTYATICEDGRQDGELSVHCACTRICSHVPQHVRIEDRVEICLCIVCAHVHTHLCPSMWRQRRKNYTACMGPLLIDRSLFSGNSANYRIWLFSFVYPFSGYLEGEKSLLMLPGGLACFISQWTHFPGCSQPWGFELRPEESDGIESLFPGVHIITSPLGVYCSIPELPCAEQTEQNLAHTLCFHVSVWCFHSLWQASAGDSRLPADPGKAEPRWKPWLKSSSLFSYSPLLLQ